MEYNVRLTIVRATVDEAVIEVTRRELSQRTEDMRNLAIEGGHIFRTCEVLNAMSGMLSLIRLCLTPSVRSIVLKIKLLDVEFSTMSGQILSRVIQLVEGVEDSPSTGGLLHKEGRTRE